MIAPGSAAMNWKRHTLLDISDGGRNRILAELTGSAGGRGRYREKLARVLLPDRAGARVPAVVRREDGPGRPGCVPVGFSQPARDRNGRLRIAAFARVEDVIRMSSPYDIISIQPFRRTATIRALSATKLRAEALGLRLGVWGSAAMELYTGLPCTGRGSDLDIVVESACFRKLSHLMLEIEELQERFSTRIDVEVDLPNGYGVQLKELTGEGRMVLGKSMSGVALFPRGQIAAQLTGAS